MAGFAAIRRSGFSRSPRADRRDADHFTGADAMPGLVQRPFEPAFAPAALAFAIALALALPEPATAAAEKSAPRAPSTVTVTNCNDSGPGSLRDAVASAVDGDAIDMTHLTCSTITLTSGEIVVGPAVSFNGPGADRLSIRVPPGSYWRNFRFTTGSNSTPTSFSRLMIEGGHVDNDDGGCIRAIEGYEYQPRPLSLSEVRVRNCTISLADHNWLVRGGAIAGREVTLRHSTISDSGIAVPYGDPIGTLAGGGIYALDFAAYDSEIRDNFLSNGSQSRGGGCVSYGDTTILRSTVSGNYVNYRSSGSDAGGGLWVARNGNLTIAESTIADNYTSIGATALYASVPTSIANSTIAGNWSNGDNLPVVQIQSSLELQSTIIAMNQWPQGETELIDLLVSGAVSGSNNLIMNSPNAPPGTLTDNPRLQPLADNGGPTRTMALPPDSPAIDRGAISGSVPWDQRGSPFARTVGAAPDIGAFEQPGDRIFRNGFDPPG